MQNALWDTVSEYKNLGWRTYVKLDFHHVYIVTRATFPLFKLNSFPLQATQKLRKTK